MTQAELKERMTVFGVNIIKLVNIMPNSVAGLAIAKQNRKIRNLAISKLSRSMSGKIRQGFCK